VKKQEAPKRDSKWHKYERAKQHIQTLNLNAKQYEQVMRVIAWCIGI